MSNISLILKISFTLLIVIIVIGYAYYKTKDMAQGPTITILSPITGATSNNTLLEVIGTAKNISHITMNDEQIFTDESGNFKEKLLLSPGYNIISIKARDKFERNTNKTLEIIYNDEKVVKRKRVGTATIKKTPQENNENTDSQLSIPKSIFNI